jgi:hypothetical protein
LLHFCFIAKFFTKTFGDEDVIQSLLLANKNLLEEMYDMEVKDPKLRKLFERISGKTFKGEMEKVARNMKMEGADLHFITRVTGLSFDEVLNI